MKKGRCKFLFRRPFPAGGMQGDCRVFCGVAYGQSAYVVQALTEMKWWAFCGLFPAPALRTLVRRRADSRSFWVAQALRVTQWGVLREIVVRVGAILVVRGALSGPQIGSFGFRANGFLGDGGLSPGKLLAEFFFAFARTGGRFSRRPRTERARDGQNWPREGGVIIW